MTTGQTFYLQAQLKEQLYAGTHTSVSSVEEFLAKRGSVVDEDNPPQVIK